jgi:prepilin-type N-terminal cleavage/methylation domain-containing protein
MESPSIFQTNNKGFTILEVLVVMGLVVVVVAFGLNINFDYYTGTLFRSERDTVVSVLERARSRATNSVGDSSHGVCYVSPNLILFKGTVCQMDDISNEVIVLDERLVITGISATSSVIFEKLSGNLTPQISPESNEFIISLTLSSRTGKISVNNIGRINW